MIFRKKDTSSLSTKQVAEYENAIKNFASDDLNRVNQAKVVEDENKRVKLVVNLVSKREEAMGKALALVKYYKTQQEQGDTSQVDLEKLQDILLEQDATSMDPTFEENEIIEDTKKQLDETERKKREKINFVVRYFKMNAEFQDVVPNLTLGITKEDLAKYDIEISEE